MNIWILNHYADAPDRQATRTYDLSRKLVERGHQVTIFSAGFSHYNFKEERITDGQTWRTEDWNGVRFIWLKTFPYRANDWRRILNMMSYAWRAFLVGRKLPDKPDVVVGVSVHPIAALTGWLLSVVRKGRFFFEVTDLWPEVLVGFGMLSRQSPITWILQKLEKFLYSRAERIIMIWPRTEEYVARYGISPQKIVWIPHLADLNRYSQLKPYDGIIGERFTIMYLGTFNNSTGTWVVPEAAKLLEDRGVRNVRFMLVGGGTGKDHLIELSARLGIQNVQFPGLVPKKEIAGIMGEADAFLVTLKNVPFLKYGISLNKACDYLASGRPTVFAGSPGYNPIEVASAGISVAAEDPQSLADGIVSLMELTPEERVQMGKNGREYLERVHGIDVLADRLEKVFLGTSNTKGQNATAMAEVQQA